MIAASGQYISRFRAILPSSAAIPPPSSAPIFRSSIVFDRSVCTRLPERLLFYKSENVYKAKYNRRRIIDVLSWITDVILWFEDKITLKKNQFWHISENERISTVNADSNDTLHVYTRILRIANKMCGAQLRSRFPSYFSYFIKLFPQFIRAHWN